MFMITILFSLFQTAEAKMMVTTSLAGNVISTSEHLFFFYNIAGGTARQPRNRDVPILTGLNASLSTADFGTISISLISIWEIDDVIRILNKSAVTKSLSLSVVNGSAPLLGSLRSIISFPDRVTLAPWETVQVDATISTTILTAPVGEYTGWVKITDHETNLSYVIPIRLIVSL